MEPTSVPAVPRVLLAIDLHALTRPIGYVGAAMLDRLPGSETPAPEPSGSGRPA